MTFVGQEIHLENCQPSEENGAHNYNVNFFKCDMKIFHAIFVL